MILYVTIFEANISFKFQRIYARNIVAIIALFLWQQ